MRRFGAFSSSVPFSFASLQHFQLKTRFLKKKKRPKCLIIILLSSVGRACQLAPGAHQQARKYTNCSVHP